GLEGLLLGPRVAWKRQQRGQSTAGAIADEPPAVDTCGRHGQYTTTLRMDSPRCIRSKTSLMRSSGKRCVIRSSMLILCSMYQSTIRGTSVRPRAPPKAVPFQTLPVTNWNGRVEISAPAGATPITIDWPQPRWQASSACRITVTLPVQSNV